jgi:hypothetical protein
MTTSTADAVKAEASKIFSLATRRPRSAWSAAKSRTAFQWDKTPLRVSLLLNRATASTRMRHFVILSAVRRKVGFSDDSKRKCVWLSGVRRRLS